MATHHFLEREQGELRASKDMNDLQRETCDRVHQHTAHTSSEDKVTKIISLKTIHEAIERLKSQNFKCATYKHELEEPAFDMKIKEAVCDFLNLSAGSEDGVITVPNKEKYCRYDISEEARSDLQEVFELMRQLNLKGLHGKTLCQGKTGGLSFAEALHSAVDDLVTHLPSGHVNYVEPIKTFAIITRLLDAGIVVDSYTAVDINPESTAVMHKALTTLLPKENIKFVNSDYHRIKHPFWGGNSSAPVLITMLGFQEGNESPKKMAQFYRRVTKPGDLLLAEMQVVPIADMRPIFDFYSNDLMRRFSKLAFRQAFGDQLKSEYGVILVPVVTTDGVRVQVAVCTERIVSEGNWKNNIFISNYCIKYTRGGFRRIRELDGAFRVEAEQCTGDGSVSFQLARRKATK